MLTIDDILSIHEQLRPDNSVKMDYIEYVLRQFAIKCTQRIHSSHPQTLAQD